MKFHNLPILALAALFAACGSDDATYDASGVFETTEVIVSAKATGELLSFNVEEGQAVKPAEQLGLIDTRQLDLKKDQLAASITANDSRQLDLARQVASVKQQIANQQRERARFAALLKDGAATQKQVDDIDYQIAVLQRQLAATEEQISSSNSSLKGQTQSMNAQIAQVDDQRANAVVTSPIEGTVLAKYAEAGEYATAGRALFKVADVKQMRLRAYITASQLTSLKLGQKVTVFADLGEADRKSYEGTVTWISDKAEFTPKTIQTRDERANLVYAVKIDVKNDGVIKRGMYGDVKF